MYIPHKHMGNEGFFMCTKAIIRRQKIKHI